MRTYTPKKITGNEKASESLSNAWRLLREEADRRKAAFDTANREAARREKEKDTFWGSPLNRLRGVDNIIEKLSKLEGTTWDMWPKKSLQEIISPLRTEYEALKKKASQAQEKEPRYYSDEWLEKEKEVVKKLTTQDEKGNVIAPHPIFVEAAMRGAFLSPEGLRDRSRMNTLWDEIQKMTTTYIQDSSDNIRSNHYLSVWEKKSALEKLDQEYREANPIHTSVEVWRRAIVEESANG